MTISSSLASLLGPGGPARWSPYARHSDPTTGRGAGNSVPPGGTSRPSLRLAPATARLLGPARKEAAAAPSGSRFRAEAAPAPDAAGPKAPRRGYEKPKQKKNPKSPNPAEREEGEEAPVQESRDGGGGFAFLCALAGHAESISGISLPVGSDKLYSGSADGSVRVWDCNSGKAWNTRTGMKSSLHGPSGLVCSMTIKDDMLFAGTGDGRIMAWKFPDEKSDFGPVAILSGHECPVISLFVSATRLYSGSLDKTIKVWDLKALQCLQTLSEHKAVVTSVLCWDEKLLSCSLDKTVKIWASSNSGKLQVIYTHAEEHGLRTLFGMHRVGKTPVLFCSLHNSNCIRLFELPSFDEMGKLFSKKEVRTIELAAGGLLFTGDGAGRAEGVEVGAPGGACNPGACEIVSVAAP